MHKNVTEANIMSKAIKMSLTHLQLMAASISYRYITPHSNYLTRAVLMKATWHDFVEKYVFTDNLEKHEPEMFQ